MKSHRTFLALVVILGLLAIWLIFWSPGDTPVPNNATGAHGVPRSMPPEWLAPAPSVASRSSRPATTPSQAPLIPSPTRGPLAHAAKFAAPLPNAPIAPDSTNDSALSDPRIEAGQVRRMVVDYHTLMGENPVGTNAEIMQALMGQNPRQATVSPFDGQKLNARGELLDKWNTPYFFHQLSKDIMEIHSAGPDRIMGTSDDIVVR